MLNKLTLRNAKRSAKDYLIYLVTMVIISALMFGFHGMIFSSDMRALYGEFAVFAALIGIASFFIMFIVIWLVHYMVNFMLEKRSREFGTYLLLGMKKIQITRIFRRENIILGVLSMLLGVLPGFLCQKIFVNAFYAILEAEYQISAEFSPWGVLITFGVLVFAYLLALVRVKRKFKKMHIRDFIYMDKQNERIVSESKMWKKIFVFIAIAYIIYFNVLVFTSGMTDHSVWGFIGGLIAAIYLLYAGLSSFFADYIKKKHNAIYKDANLFVFRQLASKIRTMRFTMGTLTILFTAALLGWTVVMMFADYQKTELDRQVPFDVAVFSDKPDASFEEQLQVLHENADLRDFHRYNIYENGTDPVIQFLYSHIDGTWKNEVFKDGKMGSSTYFGYDTYMGLTDYNRIRSMIGYEKAALESGQYILHGKEKIDDQMEEISNTISVRVGPHTLDCRTINMEPLAQNRMNGADYMIVVPDELLPYLTPYYSVMVGGLEGEVPPDLQEKLRSTLHFWDESIYEELYEIEVGEGSNQVLSVSESVMVADNLRVEGSFAIVTLCFMLAYLGIVFLCAALTIMTVQQLSDASKYRFRYEILKQLGMSKRETEKVVLKQLAVYYLCPYIVSIILSMFIGMFASERFVYYTGIRASNFQYYILALLVFSVVYAVYFIVSYVGFIRNLESKVNG